MQATGLGVLNQVRNRLLSIGLRRANEANGTALNPAGCIDTRNHRGIFVLRRIRINHAALDVGNNTRALIEGQTGDRRGVVANRAVDSLDGPGGNDTGSTYGSIARQLGALGADRTDIAIFVGEDLDRRLEKVDMDATRSRMRLGILHRVVRQSFDNLALLVRGAQGFFGTFIEVEVILGNNNVDIGNMPQLAQFQRCELHLGRSTTTKDMNVSNGVFSKTLCDVFRDLGHEHVFRVLGQNTGNIQSNISHAQNGHGLRF